MEPTKNVMNPDELMDDLATFSARKIGNLSAEDTQKCLEVVREYSETNCGWANYWMKDFLIRMLENHLIDLELIDRNKSISTN